MSNPWINESFLIWIFLKIQHPTSQHRPKHNMLLLHMLCFDAGLCWFIFKYYPVVSVFKLIVFFGSRHGSESSNETPTALFAPPTFTAAESASRSGVVLVMVVRCWWTGGAGVICSFSYDLLPISPCSCAPPPLRRRPFGLRCSSDERLQASRTSSITPGR